MADVGHKSVKYLFNNRSIISDMTDIPIGELNSNIMKILFTTKKHAGMVACLSPARKVVRYFFDCTGRVSGYMLKKCSVTVRWDQGLFVCLTILPCFTISLQLGNMWTSNKGRLKYSESDSIFVYLAEEGGNLDNFENLIFSPISQTLYHPGKNLQKKTQNIFTLLCRGQTKKKLISYLKPFGLFRARYHKVA